MSKDLKVLSIENEVQENIIKKQEDIEEKERRILSYLNTLEKYFIQDEKNGNFFQERMHRINKAFQSIKQHSDCGYVSDFNLDSIEKDSKSLLENLNEKKTSVKDQKIKEENEEEEESKENEIQKGQNDNLFENSEKEENADKEEKEEEFDNLLKYIEKELNIKDNNSTTKPNIPIENNKEERKRLSKVFLKIELKLMKHFEEKEINKSFNSMNEQPISSFSKKSEVLPRLMKNFFDSKENIAKLNNLKKRRASCFQGFNRRYSLKKNNSNSKINLCNSDKLEPFKPKDERRVSNFELDGISEDLISNKESEFPDDESESYEDDYISHDLSLFRTSLVQCQCASRRCSRPFIGKVIHEEEGEDF